MFSEEFHFKIKDMLLFMSLYFVCNYYIKLMYLACAFFLHIIDLCYQYSLINHSNVNLIYMSLIDSLIKDEDWHVNYCLLVAADLQTFCMWTTECLLELILNSWHKTTIAVTLSVDIIYLYLIK